MKQNKGKIVCTRVILFDEIISLIKFHSVENAINIILQNEQNKWKETNQTKIFNSKLGKIVPNPKFFMDCFPKWQYFINGKQYSDIELKNSNLKNNTNWDVETKIEYDAKLHSYFVLKKGK